MLYKVVTFSAKIRQINNDNLLKTILLLVFVTRFLHALMNNTVLYLYLEIIWKCLLVRSPEILSEQNLQ